MNSLILILCLATTHVLSFPNQWVEVPLDHFNLFDNRTWNMRYLVNTRHFQEGGPLFIEIGGEWTIGSWSASNPQINKLAAEHKGLYVATEHRYYGKSLPFPSNSSADTLKYLQVEQALEDLAYFIDYFKSSNPHLKNNVVIVHGCSYAGMLASWMRSRFPHLVDVAYASSAPLGVELNYPGYYEVVNEVYANVSISCIETIKKGFHVALELLETESGRRIVKNALKAWACGNIDGMSVRSIIFSMIHVLNVQYDAHRFEEVTCLVLMMDTDDTGPFERLANVVVLKSKRKGSCSAAGASSRNLSILGPNTIGWLYQTCTELGFFQTLSSKNRWQPFELDLTIEDNVKLCTKLFGEGVTEELLRSGIERTNRRYGGRNLKVTKLLSVQGTHDPWKKLGVSAEYNAEAPVIMLDGSHCVDTIEHEDDPDELIQGRKKIRDVISAWINEISTNAE